MTSVLADTHTGNTDNADAETVDDPEIELIFLGTGTSSSIPLLDCLTAPSNKKPCRTCLSTRTPEGKKNMRRNTSAVIRVDGGKDGKKTVVIDVGKNFLAAAIEWFPKYGLREIDGVLITHAHADAMNGLDDLRGWTLGGAIQDHIDVYVSQETFREVKRAFPYLVAKEFASGGGDVPDFKWHVIEDRVPFEIKDTGIRMTPFSVQHGRLFRGGADGGASPYFCFGFLVQDTIVYMSDVSAIPEEAWGVIEGGGEKTVLVTDCLRLERHTSHMGVGEAAGVIGRVGARRSYMTGFGHNVAHEEYVTMGEAVGGRESGMVSSTERRGVELMRAGLGGEMRWVRPAHDGLRVMASKGRVWDSTY